MKICDDCFNDDIEYNVCYWDSLKVQLKWENRYIADINYLTVCELGWDGFFGSEFTIKPTMTSRYV